MTATSMRPNLKPNPAWASLPLFDRAGWKRMAFGEFVESIGERAEPKDAQEEIYVGLEHLDPQCLHIRRWGKGSDVIGGKLRFRKGDIIFGKRRAYQRKLAVAEFGGICSAHAMVIRARPDKVLPEFLPFLMMSDRFMNRAVEISVGSLSPTINWTTLKLETFDLPPLGQQRRIAEILWVVDEAAETYVNSLQSCESAYAAAINHLLFNHKNKPPQRVGELSQINTDTLSDSKTDPTFAFNYIDIGSVVAPKKLGSLETYKFSDAPSRARRVVSSGDILISTVRPNLKAFVRTEHLDCAHVASTGFAVLTPKNKTIGDLLFHAFFSSQFMVHCDGRVTGTSYPAMNAKDVSDFVVLVPTDKNEQIEAAKCLNELAAASNLIESHIEKCSALHRQILEALLQTENQI